MRYTEAREIIAEAIGHLDEGLIKKANKAKKAAWLQGKGHAMRPSAFQTPADHLAALRGNARDAMRRGSSIKEESEEEVDDEGGMAMGELKSIASNANEIISMLKPESQLEGWVQSKITKSADYISSVRDYLSNTPDSVSGGEKEEKEEMDEAFNPLDFSDPAAAAKEFARRRAEEAITRLASNMKNRESLFADKRRKGEKTVRRKRKAVVSEGAMKGAMEDWLYDLPKPAIAELKAKHGKDLKRTGMGGKDSPGLHKGVSDILKKHNVKPFLGSHREGVDAVKMSFHTFHGDLNESSKTAKTQYSRKIGKIMDRIKQRVGKSPEWKPMENPFTKPFASDKKEVKESHNIKTLEGFPLSKLVKLHREYSSKGTKEAKREAANILRIMRSKQMSEAVSAGDPNRGRSGRAKPKLQPNEDPYDRYTKGEIKPYGGKLQKRLRSLSPEARQRYYREVGMRSRAASRAGKTGRLFPQV